MDIRQMNNMSDNISCPTCLFTPDATNCCNLNPLTAYGLPTISDFLPSKGVLTIIFLLYLAVVQLLRHRRQHQLTAYVAANKPLTSEPAQQVIHKLATLEFPTFHKAALQFALFRTYGIPTISGLLHKTSLFSSPATAAKRYSDTTVLIAEFMARTYGSKDWIKPMARTNAIHGHYRDNGKILEADMLYTLLLFARQPWKFIDRFEWRALTEPEINAFGTFWKAIGEAMEIDYTGLKVPGWVEDDSAPMTANGRGRGEWKNGADWLRAVDAWAEAYERKHMVPSESNAAVAEQTIMLLLDSVPKVLHPLGRQIVSSMMDTRLRKAMSIADPPVAVHCTVHTVLVIRKIMLRYLALPRPEFMKLRSISELWERNSDGRAYVKVYDSLPMYVKPSFANRWGLRAWTRWLAGKPIPGDTGMQSDGYLTDRVGPPAGKAPKEQEKRETMVEEVLGGRGCPMAFR